MCQRDEASDSADIIKLVIRAVATGQQTGARACAWHGFHLVTRARKEAEVNIVWLQCQAAHASTEW